MTGTRSLLFVALISILAVSGLLLACDDDPKDQSETEYDEENITESEACNAYCKKIIKCEIWDWEQDECVDECAQWYNGSSMGKCYYNCLDRDCDHFFECTSSCNVSGGGGGSMF